MEQTSLRTTLRSKVEPGSAGPETTDLIFVADYQDGRNQEWSKWTPNLNIQFTVKNEIADRWEPGKSYEFLVRETPVE